MLPASAVLQQQVTHVMTFFDIAFGKFTQPLFSHRAKEYRCRERTQSLIGADIRGGLFAANMLLARRECQHETPTPFVIDGFTYESPRHTAQKTFATGKKPDSRPAVAHRDTEALTFRNGDVRTQFTRRFEKSEG